MVKMVPVVFILLFLISVQSGNAQSSTGPAHSDSLITYNQFIKSIPESISGSIPSDSLKSIFQGCIEPGIKMPQFKPDSDLTASMPQIIPEKIDERIFIPWFKKCSENKDAHPEE